MSNYTKDDKEAFARKDILSARQSAAKNTATIFEGKSIPFEDFKDYAELMFKWIYEGQKPVDAVTTIQAVSDTQPQLKPAEAEVKKAVEKKLGRGITVADLDSWVNSLGKPELKSTLPQNMNSVDLIVKFLRGK